MYNNRRESLEVLYGRAEDLPTTIIESNPSNSASTLSDRDKFEKTKSEKTKPEATIEQTKGEVRFVNRIRRVLLFAIFFIIPVFVLGYVAKESQYLAPDTKVEILEKTTSDFSTDTQYNSLNTQNTPAITTEKMGVVTVSLSASGYVIARTIATVSSNVTGRIKKLYFEEGSYVKQGQVLAQLDDTLSKAEVDLYKSRLILSKNSIKETKALLTLAKKDLERLRALKKDNIVSDSDLFEKLSEVEVLEAKLLTAHSSVSVARKELNVAEKNLAEFVIRAPFSGVVISKNAQPGEIVSPISTGDGYTRTGISTIVDMNTLEVEVDVNESYIHRVYPGQKVQTRLESFPGNKIAGKVIQIVPAANRQKSTVKVRVGLEALHERILPNMGVQVDFID